MRDRSVPLRAEIASSGIGSERAPFRRCLNSAASRRRGGAVRLSHERSPPPRLRSDSRTLCAWHRDGKIASTENPLLAYSNPHDDRQEENPPDPGGDRSRGGGSPRLRAE